MLEKAALVRCDDAPVHPELALSQPCITWAPGEPVPNLGSASYRLQSRWRRAPIPTRLTAASKRAANIFGGHGGRMPVGTHRTHDLHMSAVFLLLRQNDPSAAGAWVFEERIRRERSSRSEKLPDAIIRYGEIKKVVEFGGAYSKKKLETFHRYCEAEQLPYEVW